MSEAGRRAGRGRTALLVLAAVVVVVLGGAWLLRTYVFASTFTPVTLGAREAQVLDAKLARLEAAGVPRHTRRAGPPPLTAEKYSEDEASREIVLTERELNAMLAKNTDLARKLAFRLSDDLISAKLLLPLDEDLPLLGGRTLRVTAGLRLGYADGRPVVALKGVSLWGVPLPNAWLGGLKNVDLVKEFSEEGGFWKTFGDGVELMRVEEGRLRIKLRE